MACSPEASSFSVLSSQCVCLCAVLVRNQSLCHRSGLELVTCLGSPADVPYWETVPAGFPNCALLQCMISKSVGKRALLSV